MIACEQETQRVKDLRFAYRVAAFTVDPRNLVFIDETGIHLGLTRLYGRAPQGERLYDTESPSNRGQNISLIGGMSNDLVNCDHECGRQCQYGCVLVLSPGDA